MPNLIQKACDWFRGDDPLETQAKANAELDGRAAPWRASVEKLRNREYAPRFGADPLLRGGPRIQITMREHAEALAKAAKAERLRNLRTSSGTVHVTDEEYAEAIEKAAEHEKMENEPFYADLYSAAERYREGVKFDQGKSWRPELLAPEFVYGVSAVSEYGANKYADRNWEKGMDWSRVFGALMRHMWKWWGGERVDPESGLPHLWHAGCCLMYLTAYEQRAIGTDDRGIKVEDWGT